MTDWDAIRAEFPALRNWTYLNTATYGQMPRCAAEAVSRHFARRDEFACGDFLEWFDDADHVRALLGRLVNCAADDIAFFQNASSALSLVAGAIDWQPGDRVLALENEFPNLVYCGAALEQNGVHFDQVPWERFEDSLTPRTRLVMASTVNYITGFRLPVERLVSLCRQARAFSYIDGTQSIGALRFDCAAIEPDMLSVDGYKWLLCPNGAGFAYVRPEVRRWLSPSTIGWRSDKRWREVNALHHGLAEFKDSAERYEGGMLPFPAILAMGASVNLMLGIGPAEIEQRVLELAAYARKRLAGAGARIAHENTAILAARFENADAGQLAAALRSKRVLVSARHGHLRVSVDFYNNEADIDHMMATLKAL
jgi:selenocysteine lyase/cysteine desulfurase